MEGLGVGSSMCASDENIGGGEMDFETSIETTGVERTVVCFPSESGVLELAIEPLDFSALRSKIKRPVIQF